MRMNRSASIFVIVALVAFGTASGTDATICDDDAAAVPFTPTVDSSVINAVLGSIGEITIIDVEVDTPFIVDEEKDYGHRMNVIVNGVVDLSVDFLVEPLFGSIEVTLNLPAFDTDMFITLEHDSCGDCVADWTACRTPCFDTYNDCVDSCEVTPGGLCDGDPTCCEDLCGGLFGLGGCLLGCDAEKVGCDLVFADCTNEGNLLDAFINNHVIGISYDDSTVTQVADVCVTGACRAVAPHDSTTADLVNFRIRYFPDVGFGVLLNNLITGFVINQMVDPADIIEDAVVDEDRGTGLLVSAFGIDIMNDGCAPAPEVQACRGGGCSTTTSANISTRRNASILLYSLPLVVMIGLILWKRRR